MITYHVDENKVYLFENNFSGKPFQAVVVAPPSVTAGKVAVWTTTKEFNDVGFGEDGTGSWKIKEDHRKDKLYNTEGDYKIGEDFEGKTYDGLGKIPTWLTSEAKPSPFHNLVGGVWVEDKVAKLESEKRSERAWRDGEISRYDWMRNRHNDEVFQDIPTTLSAEQFIGLVTYLQALRDWPEQVGFPDALQRPVAPAFLSQE